MDNLLFFYVTAKGSDPLDFRLWSNSSKAYFHLAEYEDSEREAVVAMKLNPFHEKVRLNFVSYLMLVVCGMSSFIVNS